MGTEPFWLSLDDFVRRYPDESQTVEFKRGLSRNKVQEAVVAFSNGQGGVVLIGVGDDGEIVGHTLTESAIQDIHKLCGAAYSVGRYDTSSVLVDDIPVTVLRVESGQGELSQTSDGRPLVRRGKMNVALTGSELAALAAERSRAKYEDGPTEAGIDLADAHLVEVVARELGWSDSERNLGESWFADRGVLTVLGCLVLSVEPHTWLGKAYVEVFRYPDDSTEYDRRERFDGPVASQIEQATGFINDELGFAMAFIGVRRVEVPKLPPKVLREALTNAVGHRDYQRNGTAVVVELRPDRVVVRSPGSLVSPVTVENIREQQASRNPRLMRVLRALRIADDAGRGVDTMIDEMRAALLDPPTFEDLGNSVVVTLPLGGTVTVEERALIHELEASGTLRADERRLLIPLLRGEELDNATVRQLLGIESHQATRALQRLAESGLVSKTGRTSAATYRPSPDLRDRLRGNTLEDHERRVLRLARDSGSSGIRNADVRSLLGVEREAARSLLTALVDRGLLRREGQRRATRYFHSAEKA